MNLYKFTALHAGALLCRSKSSKVIYYHDIHIPEKQYTVMSTSFRLFESHVAVIRGSGYKFVNTILSEQGQVQVCFDDGFRGIYDNRKYFIEQNIYPTVFLAVSLIGTLGYLSRDEIVELKQTGFRFQSHAWSHVDLTLFDDQALEYELKASKTYIEELLKDSVTEICFPLGYFSERVYNACKNAGYLLMYSSIPGDYFSRERECLIPRQLLQYYTAREVKAVLHGGLQLFRQRFTRVHYVACDVNR